MIHQRFFPAVPDIVEIYITKVLYGIGLSLIGVFIPIYLYADVGVSLVNVLKYLFVENMIAMLAAPVAMWLCSKIGVQRVTLVRIPFFLTSYLGLYLMTSTPVWLFLPAIAGGIARAFFWMPMHFLFTFFSHKNKRGQEVSLMESVPAMFKIAAPAIGGIIAASLGFPVLILIALAMISLSTMPLFVIRKFNVKWKFEWKEVFAERNHRYTLATVATGFGTVATGYLFPLHIFISLSAVQSVGFIQTIGALIYAGAVLLIGRKLSDKNMLKWYIFGAIFWACTLPGRVYLGSFTSFAAIIILGAIGGAIYTVSYDTKTYDIANQLKRKGDEFLVVREIYLNLGRMAALTIAMFSFVAGFWVAFGMVAISGLAYLIKK